MSLAKLRTPEHLPLSSTIATTIRDAILDGTLLPGEHLVEAAIAEQMGVSRAPVREAILNLRRQGWVTHIPRKGAYVAEWTTRDIEELYTLRMVLEGLSARLAAIKITPEQVEELEDTVHALGRSRDVETSVQLDQRFHSLLCVAADHASLEEVLTGMQMRTTLFIARSRPGVDVVDSDNLARLTASHRAILEAVRSGEPDLAEQCMREHIESSGLRLLSRLQDENHAPRSA